MAAATDRVTSILQRVVVVLLLALVVVAVVTFLRSGKSDAKPPASDSYPAGSYVTESGLPAGARSTIRRIDAGGPFPSSTDGTVYANDRHLLPTQAAGYYHRYSAGGATIVQGTDGTLYYSIDGGRSFRQIRR